MARAVEPFGRQAVGAAMRMMGEIFVMGRTIDEALKRMKKPEHQGFTASFDMLGEAARTQADAARYFAAYTKALAAVGRVAGAGPSMRPEGRPVGEGCGGTGRFRGGRDI